jgi:adenine-specific DNA-methyltransferase
LVSENRIWFGPDGKSVPSIKRFLSEVKDGMVSKTIWYRSEVGDNQEAKMEIKILFRDDQFGTPKPERLIKRILDLSTKQGDWVLDSFLGSGTTSSVAHKMGRKHIGIEFGNHANTHCLPRLKKVVDGNDGLALSKTLDWKGGGGFKFYNLAPSLLRKDSYGNFVIDENYNANMLAAAVCKHEAFKYNPDETSYWKQGQSTESDYIFVTTGFVTMEQLESIHAQMMENESLLICAKSFAPGIENKFINITVKKIPQIILGKCEFGQDNYDLNIIKATEEQADDSEDEQNEQ